MTPMGEIRQFKDLLAIRRANGEVLGFHARNLQVARLSEEAWESLDSTSAGEVIPVLREWEESINPDIRKERQETGVRDLTVNVTQVCNLACKYCAAGGDGTYGDPVKRIVVEETLPTLKAFISKVPAGESFSLKFLGGEPLLYPQGIQLLAEEAQRLAAEFNVAVHLSIVTNGTLLSPENISLLKRFAMDVAVSIDGSAKVNDLRRPTKSGRGLSAQIEAGLTRMMADREGLGEIELSGVFGKGNLDLMEAYLYYRQFNTDLMNFSYDHHEATEEINQAYMEQMARVAQYAYKTEGETGLCRINFFKKIFVQLDNQQQIENYCGAGKSFLMLDARQNLYTCPWSVGEPKEVVGHGGKVWEDKLKPYEQNLIEKHGCGSCWARYLCGGGCMYINRQVTGDKHRVDTNFCERTRFLINLAISYYEQSRGT